LENSEAASIYHVAENVPVEKRYNKFHEKSLKRDKYRLYIRNLFEKNEIIFISSFIVKRSFFFFFFDISLFQDFVFLFSFFTASVFSFRNLLFQSFIFSFPAAASSASAVTSTASAITPIILSSAASTASFADQIDINGTAQNTLQITIGMPLPTEISKKLRQLLE
jgi:hypothetical protein